MSSLADIPELVGFFSYSRDDDESYRGRLSALREAIQHELSAQLGRSRKNFRLWQDHEAIAPGRLWEAEIKAAVEQAVFFIPIVTPRAVNSQHCQFEFESFLARERALGRSDLVFPILYVPVPALENEAQWRDHPVLSVIGARQYVDWQSFRYADAPTPAMREEIARFARKIVEALSRPWLSPDERARQEEAAAQARAETERRLEEAERQRRAEADASRASEQAQAERLAQERRQREAEVARRAEEEGRRAQAEQQARERGAEERRRQEAEAAPRADAERAFAAARRAYTAAAVDAFLAAHPQSHLAEEAKTLRTFLAERDDAQKAALASDDPAVLRAFLARYPGGTGAEEVRSRLRRFEPAPGWQPSRRAMLIGGGAVVGAIGAGAIVANRRTAPQPEPAPAPVAVATPAAPPAPPAPAPAPAPTVVRSSTGPIKIGFSNPLTGPFAAFGTNQLTGAQVAIDLINSKGGVLGRRLDLVSYDSPDPGGAGAVASKLIEIDKVDVLVGNLQSAAAIAISQVASVRGVLQIVPGARANEITGAQCKWHVFRIGSTAAMQANAICPAMLKAHGKSWFFITADFAFGRDIYQAYDAALKKLGGRIAGNVLAPLGSADFSSYLIQAQAAKPDVLVPLMFGSDLVNCIKQARQFGIDRQVYIGGSQIDLETIATLPPEARIGTWMLDWYWRQVVNPVGLDAFVAAVRKRTGKVPTAHTWFGYVAVQIFALACEAAKTTDSKAVASALTNMPLPLDLRMQPNSAFIRGADHQLLSSAFIGELVAKGDGDPENLVKITSIIAGDTIAPPVAETGCVMRLPA